MPRGGVATAARKDTHIIAVVSVTSRSAEPYDAALKTRCRDRDTVSTAQAGRNRMAITTGFLHVARTVATKKEEVY